MGTNLNKIKEIYIKRVLPCAVLVILIVLVVLSIL